MQDYGNSWAFEEAQKILNRINNKIPEKGFVLFETGYGPSGLPHIGTFGEVARTTMVLNAFKTISDIPVKLYAFSDDMDGLRKVPDNIPNPELVRENLGRSLSAIPDPFGTHNSYAENMNSKLCAFLDQFNFEYEFKSASQCYKSGYFDQSLLQALKHYDSIMQVMLPTLGEERQASYSPFLPICPDTGIVLQVPVIKHSVADGTITYKKENGEEVTTKVTGGNCKLQWKADWAMRWYALEVDYEMHGKDLIPTAILSAQICNIMGKKEPVLFNYELFLDEQGKKISKSKGNGITIDEWLEFAPTESLALYMFQSPKKAKKLHFDVIPRQVDDYLTFLNKYEQEGTNIYNNPVWHIHNGNPPKVNMYGLNFNLLLNLASACNPEDETVLWGFIKKYAPQANIENSPFLARLVFFAVKYYNRFIKPFKNYRIANDADKILINDLKSLLKKLNNTSTHEEIQNHIYDLGTASGLELKNYFQLIYEILLGQSAGPRLGTFVAVYGVSETIKLIDSKVSF